MKRTHYKCIVPGCPKFPCGKCIRGLLCTNCNLMIGHYEKCKGDLKIEILENYRNQPKVVAK